MIRTSVYHKYSGATKITSHLVHISHCKTASGTDWSNGWTYRVFILITHRDFVDGFGAAPRQVYRSLRLADFRPQSLDGRPV